MTKKIFVGMSAMAMLFATSCQDDMNLPGNVGETTTVAFNVSTPEIGTRAYSDGQTATVLQYAVYEGNVELDKLTKSVAKRNAETINTSKEVQLQLTTGNEYTVIFWAAAPNAPYTVNFADKTMTVDYTDAVSNDENRDAFYAAHTFTVSGAQTENVQLRRPFAQLNIGTEDYEEAKNAGYEPTKSMVTVKSLGNTLNLWDGTVSGNPEEVIVNFDYAALPQGETFPVTGYEYLAMNYLLVGADQEVVDIEFGYTETDATAAKTRTVGSVPVQRNYRTNIYGKLLTSTVDVNVEIEPDFDEPAHGLAALQNAALNGGEVTLNEDITLTTPLEVYGKMTINLNGKTITGTMHKSVGHVIKNNGTLTISGGTISSTANNGGSAIQNNGTLTVEDATLNGAPNADGSWPAYTVNNTGVMTAKNVKITSYHGSVASYGEGALVTLNDSEIDMAGIPGFTSHGIYTYNNGKVVVNGGTYANKATDQNSTGSSVINGAVTVNSGTFSGRIENYYGTPVLKGGTFSVKPNVKFIAEGYKVIENKVDGVEYYSVVEEGTVVENPIVTASQLQALGNTTVSGTYNLLADIDMSGYEMQPIILSGSNAELVFNGNGHTIKNLNLVNITKNVDAAGLFTTNHAAKKLTVSDLKIVNATSNGNNYSSVVFAYNSDGCEVELNNVDVEGATINGKTVSALVSYTTNNVKLTNCDVKNITLQGERDDKIGAFVGTANGANCIVAVSNCTNNTQYKVAGRVISGATMTIDGMQYVANNDALQAALKNGASKILLADGNYTFNQPEITADNVKISGINKDNCKVSINKSNYYDGKSLTFENLTLDVPAGLTYDEHNFAFFHHVENLVINSCKSNGRLRLNVEKAEINNCEFDVTTSSGFDGYAIFYYGPTASNVKVSNSVFNTVGKAIVLYNEGKPVLNLDVTNCQFKSSASTDKAAIQMHTEYGISGTVDIVNSTATGFANINGGLWNEVNNNTKVSTDNFEITVDGVKVH